MADCQTIWACSNTPSLDPFVLGAPVPPLLHPVILRMDISCIQVDVIRGVQRAGREVPVPRPTGSRLPHRVAAGRPSQQLEPGERFGNSRETFSRGVQVGEGVLLFLWVFLSLQPGCVVVCWLLVLFLRSRLALCDHIFFFRRFFRFFCFVRACVR